MFRLIAYFPSILYDALVTPLVYIFELIFVAMYHLFKNAGLSIVGVSIAVNFLVLPLYKMADNLQQQERIRQAYMAHWVDHIKRHFKGDEQYLLLSTYYRQQGYKQWYALGSSFSLLLQIPVFIAAYSFLSNLSLLNSVSFLLIQDLSQQDKLVNVAGITLNLLPVLMTFLNCLSTFFYTRDLSLREKLQTYGLAILFLVLLYRSPSGLVLYWTCNQIFSLIKNIVSKVFSTKKTVAPSRATSRRSYEDKTPAFILSALVITVLLGVIIPSALIVSSPNEFFEVYGYENPLYHIVDNTAVWGGFFLIWCGVYYFLMSQHERSCFAVIMSCIASVMSIDFFLFGKNLGIINSSLIFETTPSYSMAANSRNFFFLIVVCVVVLAIWKHHSSVVIPSLGIVLTAFIVLSIPNLVSIKQALNQYRIERGPVNTTSDRQYDARLFADGGQTPIPIIKLSTTGQNIVVLFLDRGMSCYLPYIINERPELAAIFEGFTYYPNTLSYGGLTAYGAPPLYGGYEYVPAEMNKRSDELMVDKHNESLMVLPVLFSENGYHATMLDPPFPFYRYNSSDYSFYDEYSNIDAYRTETAYTYLFDEQIDELQQANYKRSFVFYSLFKAMPTSLQPIVYDSGNYHTTAQNIAINRDFLHNFSVLTMLGNITEFNKSYGELLVLHNFTPHYPQLLQMPNYEFSLFVDNDNYEDLNRFTLDGVTIDMTSDPVYLPAYHSTIASLIMIGDWLQYLKDADVYDNTRIIIVSDHGYIYPQLDSYYIDDVFNEEVFGSQHLNIQTFNPLLMVKDFNSTGTLITSDEFMTNADTPTLAVEGVIDNPINPFTGNVIDSSDKYEHAQYVTTSWHHNVSEYHQGNIYDLNDGYYYAVHDDIFDHSNWQRVDYDDSGLWLPETIE